MNSFMLPADDFLIHLIRTVLSYSFDKQQYLFYQSFLVQCRQRGRAADPCRLLSRTKRRIGSSLQKRLS